MHVPCGTAILLCACGYQRALFGGPLGDGAQLPFLDSSTKTLTADTPATDLRFTWTQQIDPQGGLPLVRLHWLT